jgi:hypothetical protein
VRFGGFRLDEDGVDGLLGLWRRAGRDDDQYRNDEGANTDLQAEGIPNYAPTVALKARYSRPTKQPSECGSYP